MNKPFASPGQVATVEAVDEVYLTQLLRCAGYQEAEAIAFTREPAARQSHGGGQVHRFRLTTRSLTGQMDTVAPTSLILKETCGLPSQALDPAYARREADCYHQDLFAGLGMRLHVPRAHYALAAPEVGQCWIWMEDLGAAFDVVWTPHLLASAVRDLAELQALWWGRGQELARMPFLRSRLLKGALMMRMHHV